MVCTVLLCSGCVDEEENPLRSELIETKSELSSANATTNAVVAGMSSLVVLALVVGAGLGANASQASRETAKARKASHSGKPR